mmetsp:Transcript_3698/g.5465  ORF Transcript_3698/g.5465 Transcript_3698/m.5465 type:complete len:1169 (-) Transcript_3698:154-3660(-)
MNKSPENNEPNNNILIQEKKYKNNTNKFIQFQPKVKPVMNISKVLRYCVNVNAHSDQATIFNFFNNKNNINNGFDSLDGNLSSQTDMLLLKKQNQVLFFPNFNTIANIFILMRTNNIEEVHMDHLLNKEIIFSNNSPPLLIGSMIYSINEVLNDLGNAIKQGYIMTKNYIEHLDKYENEFEKELVDEKTITKEERICRILVFTLLQILSFQEIENDRKYNYIDQLKWIYRELDVIRSKDIKIPVPEILLTLLLKGFMNILDSVDILLQKDSKYHDTLTYIKYYESNKEYYNEKPMGHKDKVHQLSAAPMIHVIKFTDKIVRNSDKYRNYRKDEYFFDERNYRKDIQVNEEKQKEFDGLSRELKDYELQKNSNTLYSPSLNDAKYSVKPRDFTQEEEMTIKFSMNRKKLTQQLLHMSVFFEILQYFVSNEDDYQMQFRINIRKKHGNLLNELRTMSFHHSMIRDFMFTTTEQFLIVDQHSRKSFLIDIKNITNVEQIYYLILPELVSDDDRNSMWYQEYEESKKDLEVSISLPVLYRFSIWSGFNAEVNNDKTELKDNETYIPLNTSYTDINMCPITLFGKKTNRRVLFVSEKKADTNVHSLFSHPFSFIEPEVLSKKMLSKNETDDILNQVLEIYRHTPFKPKSEPRKSPFYPRQENFSVDNFYITSEPFSFTPLHLYTKKEIEEKSKENEKGSKNHSVAEQAIKGPAMEHRLQVDIPEGNRYKLQCPPRITKTAEELFKIDKSINSVLDQIIEMYYYYLTRPDHHVVFSKHADQFDYDSIKNNRNTALQFIFQKSQLNALLHINDGLFPCRVNYIAASLDIKRLQTKNNQFKDIIKIIISEMWNEFTPKPSTTSHFNILVWCQCDNKYFKSESELDEKMDIFCRFLQHLLVFNLDLLNRESKLIILDLLIPYFKSRSIELQKKSMQVYANDSPTSNHNSSNTSEFEYRTSIDSRQPIVVNDNSNFSKHRSSYIAPSVITFCHALFIQFRRTLFVSNDTPLSSRCFQLEKVIVDYGLEYSYYIRNCEEKRIPDKRYYRLESILACITAYCVLEPVQNNLNKSDFVPMAHGVLLRFLNRTNISKFVHEYVFKDHLLLFKFKYNDKFEGFQSELFSVLNSLDPIAYAKNFKKPLFINSDANPLYAHSFIKKDTKKSGSSSKSSEASSFTS